MVERLLGAAGAVDATRTPLSHKMRRRREKVARFVFELILARPADLRLPAAQIKYKARGREVALETNVTALFVVLTTRSPGRFADNACSPCSPGGKRWSSCRSARSTRGSSLRRSVWNTPPSGRGCFDMYVISFFRKSLGHLLCLSTNELEAAQGVGL